MIAPVMAFPSSVPTKSLLKKIVNVRASSGVLPLAEVDDKKCGFSLIVESFANTGPVIANTNSRNKVRMDLIVLGNGDGAIESALPDCAVIG